MRGYIPTMRVAMLENNETPPSASGPHSNGTDFHSEKRPLSDEEGPRAIGLAATASPHDLVKHYLGRLKCVWRKGAEADFEIAAILDEASNRLDNKHLNKLAELFGLSRATISRYLKLHRNRFRLEPYIDKLPDSGRTSTISAHFPILS